MNKQQYREYLQTPHWLRTRARIVARAEQHCERCGRFCGFPLHDPDWPCRDESCEWCINYFDDGVRNDVEVQRLEVHHKTYDRVGHERDEDLIALCESCHDHFTERTLDLKTLVGSGREAVRLANNRDSALGYFREKFRSLMTRLRDR